MGVLTFDDVPDSPDRTPEGVKRVVIATPRKDRILTFDDIPDSGGLDTAKDIGKSIVSGLDRGVAGLAGLPADVARGATWLLNQGRAYVQDRPFEDVQAEEDKRALISRQTLEDWGGAAIHAASGLQHTPTTTPGEYAQTAAEFIPAAVLGPGSVARNVIAQGIVPGLVSEAAGQATKGSDLEPYARGGAALLSGGAGAWATSPNAAQAAVARAARGATPAQVDEAERLFQHAQQIGNPLTRAEALQYVSGGATNLGNIQRVAEGAGELRPFMAQRPQQLRATARQQFDTVAPPPTDPFAVGPAVGTAAREHLADVQQDINAAARPYYQAAEGERFSPQEWAAIHPRRRQETDLQAVRDFIAAQPNRRASVVLPQLQPIPRPAEAIPGFGAALHAVRNTPDAWRIAHLPDNSVGVLNRIKIHFDKLAEDAASKFTPGGRDRAVQSSHEMSASAVKQIAEAKSSAYATALAIEREGRRQFLEPLMHGPLGTLAKKDIDTQRAITALFPEGKLLSGGERQISQAVTTLAARNPSAARQLVRAHIEQTFDEAVQRLQSGANEFGGAGFAAVLRGNPQQARNLDAAITALRGGQANDGFNRFLQVLEAQGQRQRIGSQTSFNTELMNRLKQAGIVGEALSGVASAGVKLPSKINQKMQEWRLGANMGQVADILTNPRAASLFRRLATEPPQSARALATAAQLTYLATRGGQNTKDAQQ